VREVKLSQDLASLARVHLFDLDHPPIITPNVHMLLEYTFSAK
jgi:hypothetical protein